MANKNPQVGLRPLPDAKGTFITSDPIPVSSSYAIVLAIGSSVFVSAGELLGTPDYTDGTESVSGVVQVLMTDSGKSVLSIPASTDGYKAIITTDAGQRYAIRVSGTGIADADRGKMYSLTNETQTASPDGFTGRGFSLRELDSTTEAADGEPGDPERDCFPPVLRFKLGPDGTHSDNVILRLIDSEDLEMREAHLQERRKSRFH